MNPIITALLLVVTLIPFGVSARRRWRLLMIGREGTSGLPVDRVADRVRKTLRFAFGQRRLTRYRVAGLAHKAIFFGFFVLLLRSLILFARGFVDDPTFGYWIFDGGTPLGNLYGFVKDVYVVLVVIVSFVFLYLRLVSKPKRMTHSAEGVVILLIIVVMMIGDVVYDGATHALASSPFNGWEPLGSVMGAILGGASESALHVLQHAGFWIHVALVLLFLNLLPFSKHFHIVTAIPNVFFGDLGARGRLAPIEDLEGRVAREQTLGVKSVGELSPKSILDLYTCTECGRCTDQCPAARTGKQLSPKLIITELRDALYQSETDLVSGEPSSELVPAVIDPEMLWACTTCGACEQECPVLIQPIQKIVDLRRYLVQEKGEFPGPLQEAFQSIEVTGSPYGVGGEERLKWAERLDVPIRAETDDVEILFWVGCAPATDERAKRVARATAELLNTAGIKWAVLGSEEMCTGDVARRAGNEFLFQAMAETNIEILNGYETKRILTICPHCYNTLKNEYPDFGGTYDVVHHTDFLADLVATERLQPTREVKGRVVFHDSCYLGRFNDIYASPRTLLAAIPGVTVVEAEASGDRGMCCGAGGGQMFKEDEPGDERINFARCEQLLETGAETITTACPFCMRMLTDALSLNDHEDIEQLDIAEILLKSL